MASNRRKDVPEKVGGPASTSTLKGWGGIGTERSSATAAEVGDRLSHEDMNPGTGDVAFGILALLLGLVSIAHAQTPSSTVPP